ncbi:MAG TPA: hypothetical protein VF546_23290 [Pyrinomonadaceae bacterium]
MATVQSNLSANQSNQSPVALADRAQRRLFVLSVVFGVVAALIGALLAWLLWRANNTYQETVRAEANARIAEAGDSAAKANERAAGAEERAGEANKAAGRANERAGELELRAQELAQQNLELRSGVANLEIEAANARAEQQRIQTELAKQQIRAANAEAALLKLKEEIKDRDLTAEQRGRLLEFLRANPRGTVRLAIPLNNAEAMSFALILSGALKEGGWNVTDIGQIAGVQFVPGLSLVVESAEESPSYAGVLQRALGLIGLPAEGFFLKGMAQKEKEILVETMRGDKLLWVMTR